ncbi:MAG: sulfite exporter TauE/SafE family protein [Pseudomonadota bacterium]
MFVENATIILSVLAAGAAAGFAGGLFGVGGGVITVPTLFLLFKSIGVADAPSLKSAIGTSLALIIIISIRSLITHQKAGHVDKALLKGWRPWIALGAAIGGATARWAPAELLALVFAGGAFFVGWQRLFDRRKREARKDHLSDARLRVPVGFGTGLFASLMGTGGGALGIVIMTLSGRPIHQSIGTSAGFGVAVAIPGALGFIVSGLGVEGLPPTSLGYVNLGAFAAMAVCAAFAAPLGARVAHAASATVLSKIFGAYVIFAGAAILVDVFMP